MQILSISLKDFKSHIDSYFTFELGTNAICGENGAGKTSILEGIAWVLFDHSPYSAEEMTRSGSAGAEVAVRFISSADDRTYEVRRGTNFGYRIFDPQLNHKLEYERKVDVIPWLRQQLGIPAGTDLAKLFTTTIGVPQGTFTADFLKTGQDRKKVFDSILKVEEYQTVARNLLTLQNHSTDEVTQAKHEIEKLLVRLQDWDPLQAEQEQLKSLVVAQTTALQQSKADRIQLQAELTQLEIIAQNLAQLDQQIQILTHQLDLQKLKLDQAIKDLNAAQTAHEQVIVNQLGFQQFQLIEKQLQALEHSLQERHRLIQQREEILQQNQEQQSQRIRLQERLNRLSEAEIELAQLQPKIEQQKHLESQIEHLNQSAAQLKELQQAVDLLRTQWQSQQKQNQQFQQALEQAQQAQQLCETNLQGYQTFLAIKSQLIECEKILTQRRQLLKQKEHLIAQHHQLQLKSAGLTQQHQRFAQLEQDLVTLQPLVIQQESLEQDQIGLQKRIQHFQTLKLQLEQYQHQHQAQQQELESLKTAISQRIQYQQDLQQIPTLEQQQERIRTQLSRIAAAQQFQQELQIAFDLGNQRLTQQTQQVQQVLRSLQQIQRDFPELSLKLQSIPTVLTQTSSLAHQLLDQLEQVLLDISHQVSVPQLEEQQQILASKLQQYYPLQGLVDQLPDLQAKQENLTLFSQNLAEKIDDLAWDLEAEPTLTRQLTDLHAQLQTLSDPRSQIRLIQQELKNKSQLNKQHQQLTQQLDQLTQQLDPLEAELQNTATLETEIATYQNQQQQYQDSYQLYLKSESLAITVPQREQDYQQAQQLLQQIQKNGSDQQAEIAGLESRTGNLESLAITLQQVNDKLKSLQDPRSQAQRLQQQLEQKPQIEQEHKQLIAELETHQIRLQSLENELKKSAPLETEIITLRQQREEFRSAYDLVNSYEALAKTLPQCQQDQQRIQSELQALATQQTTIQTSRDYVAETYNLEHHQQLKENFHKLEVDQAGLQAQIKASADQLTTIEKRIRQLEDLKIQQKAFELTLAERERLHRFIKFSREVFKKAGPRITELYLHSVNFQADRLFREILNRSSVSLNWEPDYDITVQESSSPKRRFISLSGGEQMSAALAVRLALLKVLGEMDIAFFDEPTTNMDQTRRRRLAEAITNIKSFRQLFVISHDDTFEQITENIIRVERKDPGYGA